MKAFDQTVLDSTVEQYWNSYNNLSNDYIAGLKTHAYSQIKFVDGYRQIANSSFESGLSDWTFAGSWSWSQDYSYIGGSSASTVLDSTEQTAKPDQIFVVSEAQEIYSELRVFVDFESVGGTIDLVAENYASGAFSSESIISSIDVSTIELGSWIKLSGVHIVPATNDGFVPKLVVRNDNTSGTVYVDGLRVRSVSDLTGEDQVTGNRPICSEQIYSISLSRKLGLEIQENTFSLTMLVLPGSSMGDLVSIDCDGYLAGVRLVGNKLIELYGMLDGEEVSELFTIGDWTQYLHLSKGRNTIGVAIGNVEHEIEIEDSASSMIFLGELEDYLIDKIILSINGDLFTQQDYSINLSSSSITNVYRPGDSCFGIVREQNSPLWAKATAADLFDFEGNQYFTYQIVEPYAPLMLNNQTDYNLEYSLNGEDFSAGSELTRLDNIDNAVTVKLPVADAEAIDGHIIFTESPTVIEEQQNFYDFEFTGPVYLSDKTYNSYWHNPDGSTINSSVKITNSDDPLVASIRTIELILKADIGGLVLMNVDGQDIDASNLDTFATLYINGVARPISGAKFNQNYHMLIVLDSVATEVIVNPNQDTVNAVGIGASSVAMDAFDAERIWNIISGGKVISESATLPMLEDGVSTISGAPTAVIDLQWQMV